MRMLALVAMIRLVGAHDVGALVKFGKNAFLIDNHRL